MTMLDTLRVGTTTDFFPLAGQRLASSLIPLTTPITLLRCPENARVVIEHIAVANSATAPGGSAGAKIFILFHVANGGTAGILNAIALQSVADETVENYVAPIFMEETGSTLQVMSPDADDLMSINIYGGYHDVAL
jgi:hypothetical protein